MANISEIELSQLRLLRLIFETKNLTQAGAQAGLTQSAVSHTLKKLRHSFNDSLVIRQGNTLVLTPRGESLKVPLDRWLSDFEKNILFQEPFDPLTSKQTFYVATSDLVEQVLAPKLIEKFQSIAPDIRVIFKKLDKRGLASQIESGEVDFSISVVDSSHPNLMVRTLYRDSFQSVVRTGHPLLKKKKTMAAFCSYPHIIAGTGKDDRGIVDHALMAKNMTRDLKYKVANFSSAPYVVESSDSIFTAPTKFVDNIVNRFNLKAFKSPVQLDDYVMKLYWDIKNKDDLASRWFREQIFEVLN